MINKRTLLIVICEMLLKTLWAGGALAGVTSAPAPDQPADFVEAAQLLAPDGKAGDHFGIAVDVDGDTMVVGTTYFSYLGNPTEPDAAYVFVRDGGAWAFQAKLTASDGTAGDRFGGAVAIDGDTILVGAYFADVGGNEDQGAAYIFTRSGETWSEQGKLLAGDGALADQFGWSVALSGDTALVGVDRRPVGGQLRQGAAYIFTRSGDSWSQQTRLAAGDGANGDQFGYGVALSGGTAIVGARGATVDGNMIQGAAYVFTYEGAAWNEQGKLTASDGDVGDSFGDSVAFDGTTAIVGAPFATVDGAFGRGAAYLFTGGGAAWSEQVKLSASDHTNDGQFGEAVAVDGDTVLVGTPLADVNGVVNQGAAYVFMGSGSNWTEHAKLSAADGAAEDRFGASVALDQNSALVGAPNFAVDGALEQGAAYVFERWEGAYSLYLPAISGD